MMIKNNLTPAQSSDVTLVISRFLSTNQFHRCSRGKCLAYLNGKQKCHILNECNILDSQTSSMIVIIKWIFVDSFKLRLNFVRAIMK